MFYRMVSATGQTSGADEDIMGAMRLFTTLQGQAELGDNYDSIEPFRPVMRYFEVDGVTDIKVNGEGATFLEEHPTKSGSYIVNLDNYDLLVKNWVVTTSGINWRATFLY